MSRETMFYLRAVVSLNEEYGVFVGRCLETGNVATADDAETCEEMMRDLLIDECSFAVRHRNIANLFSHPSKTSVWLDWYRLRKSAEAKDTRHDLLDNADLTISVRTEPSGNPRRAA